MKKGRKSVATLLRCLEYLESIEEKYVEVLKGILRLVLVAQKLLLPTEQLHNLSIAYTRSLERYIEVSFSSSEAALANRTVT